MKRGVLILIVLAVAGVAAGVVVLGTMELPAPSEPVVKELPDDRFPR